jgi:hypothetical protein
MTSKEFTLWLKGFTEGVHEFNVTPKQWDTLKEQLAHVDDNTIPMGGLLNDHNTFRKNKYSDAIDVPMPNPYGTRGPETPTGTTITTTPGVGSITIANPPFGFGSTSTAYGYPSGSAWSYTNNTYSGDMGTIGTKPKTQTDYQNEHKTKFKKRKAKSVKEWEDEIDLGGEE